MTAHAVYQGGPWNQHLHRRAWNRLIWHTWLGLGPRRHP